MLMSAIFGIIEAESDGATRLHYYYPTPSKCAFVGVPEPGATDTLTHCLSLNAVPYRGHEAEPFVWMTGGGVQQWHGTAPDSQGEKADIQNVFPLWALF